MTVMGENWRNIFKTVSDLRLFLARHGVYLPELRDALVIMEPTRAIIYVNCMEIQIRPIADNDWFYDKRIDMGEVEIGVFVFSLCNRGE